MPSSMSTCQPLPPKFKSDKEPFSALKWGFENGEMMIWHTVYGKGLSNTANTGGRQGENELLTGVETEKWKLYSYFQSSSEWRNVQDFQMFWLKTKFQHNFPSPIFGITIILKTFCFIRYHNHCCLKVLISKLTHCEWVKKAPFLVDTVQTTLNQQWIQVRTMCLLFQKWTPGHGSKSKSDDIY